MFICRRLLQLSVLAPFFLAACASSQTPTPATDFTDTASGGATLGATPGAIRIGPSEPTSESSDEPSATALPSGKLRPEVVAFARDLAERGNLPLDQVMNSLSSARYSATAARLIRSASPSNKVLRSWRTYRSRVVEPTRIRWGVAFWQANAATLDQAANRYGVPAKIIVGIIGIETAYGRNMGDFRVVDVLSTLAFDYPVPDKPDRVEMFRDQLAAFITLTLQGRLDTNTLGSFAGAIGMPQFMPDSIARYAVDGSGNATRHIDLANNPADAIMSVGNYLSSHGWVPGVPVFAPVALPPYSAALAALATGGLEPTLDWNKLKAAGAELPPGAREGAWSQQPMGVVDLAEEALGTVQYRAGTPNFFAITQYNHSYFYAAAVSDLADALAEQVGRTPPKDTSPPPRQAL